MLHDWMVLMRREEKGDYGWLQGEVLRLNPVLLSPVLERRTSRTWRNIVMNG